MELSDGGANKWNFQVKILRNGTFKWRSQQMELSIKNTKKWNFQKEGPINGTFK